MTELTMMEGVWARYFRGLSEWQSLLWWKGYEPGILEAGVNDRAYYDGRGRARYFRGLSEWQSLLWWNGYEPGILEAWVNDRAYYDGRGMSQAF